VYYLTEANVADRELYPQSGIRCLHTVQKDHPDRLSGPFVRRREDTIYVLDELVSRPSPYNFVLPRALVGHSDLLSLYGEPELAALRTYVDQQEVSDLSEDSLFSCESASDLGYALRRTATIYS
jgi:hypothetical protein